MAHNLHVSYDLYSPGQNYDRVIAAIKELGGWAKIHKSYWFVTSDLTAEQARDHVWKAMDPNDALYVVDAKDNSAAWMNLNDESTAYIKANWSSR